MVKKQTATPTQIERMYDSGENRVTQERNDFFLPQIRDFVRDKKWLNLRPEYQRRLVWDKKKKSLFIESLLMNVPVPPVFLYEYDLNRYEVMDGQQRLNSILEFYENRLVLTGLETWSALNGLTYSECPPRIRAGLDRGKNARQLLGYISKNKNIDVTPIYRGLLVALAGAFEHFIRRLIRDALTFYNERVTRFDDVPEKLRHQNILRTGKALATIAQPFDQWPVNYE